MKANYYLSPLAQIDLDKISDYTAARWGREQARAYVRQLTQCFQLLAEKLMKGRACPEVKESYYKYNSGSHYIFYRLTDHGVDIVRVLHERMDFRQYL